jgi:uncharacterized protein YqeY
MTDAPTPAEGAKARIRADIRAAMTAKNMVEAKLLRTLLAALDNAEAVSVAIGPYVERAFGDPATEVARKTLTREDVEAVIEAESAERLAAARDLERHGRAAEAATLQAEAALLQRYLKP